MKKFIYAILFCFSVISFVSCTYRRNIKLNIKYAVHYPDTTIITDTIYRINFESIFKHDLKDINNSGIKVQLYSHKGSNAMVVRFYDNNDDNHFCAYLQPFTTAPIRIINYKICNVGEIE